MASAEIVLSARNLLSGPLAKVRASMEAARKSVEGLEQTAAKVRQLGELRGKVQASADAMRNAQAEATRLASQIAATERPSAALKRQFEQAKKAAAALKNEHLSQVRALGSLGSELRAAGVNTANLGGAQAKLRRQIADATRELERQAQRTRLLERADFGVTKIRAAGREIKDKIGGALRSTAMGAAAGAGIAALFNRVLIKPAADFEQYTIQLTGIERSADKATAALKWVSDYAAKTPYELDGLMKTYVQLRAMGLDPMDGTMKAIADQAAKLGGKQEDLAGISLALGQAWTKQKLQGDDILQLVGRGVPVWDLLSKATGKSVPALMKLSEAGKLGRNAIKLLLDAMEKDAPDAAEKMSTSWNGMVSNLSDQWNRFANMVMAAGLFDWLKSRLGEVMDRLNQWAADGTMQRVAHEWATNIKDILSAAWNLAAVLIPAMAAIARAANAVAEKIGGWKVLLGVFVGFKLVSGILGVAAALGSAAQGFALLARAIPLVAGLSSIGTIATTAVTALAPLTLALGSIAAILAGLAGGYAIGWAVNKGLDAAISKLRGKDASLGTTIYDWLHPNKPGAATPEAPPARGRAGRGSSPNPAPMPSQAAPTLATPRPTLAPARPTVTRAPSQPATPVAVGGSVAIDVRVKDERTTTRVTRVETRNPAVPVDANVGTMLGAY